MHILHKQLEWRWREERLLLSPKLIYGPLSVLNFECGSRTNRSLWCSSREEHLESSRDSGPLWLLHILGCCFPVSHTLTHGYSKCIWVWAAFVLAFFFFYFEGHVFCIRSSDIYMASFTWRTKKCDIGGKTYYFTLCGSKELLWRRKSFNPLQRDPSTPGMCILCRFWGTWVNILLSLNICLVSLHLPRFKGFLLYFLSKSNPNVLVVRDGSR